MERQRREAAQKVKDYHTYHLSGDLSEQIAGQVAQGILHFDSPLKEGQNLQQNTRPAFNIHHIHELSRSRSEVNNADRHPANVFTPENLNQQVLEQYPLLSTSFHQDKLSEQYPLSCQENTANTALSQTHCVESRSSTGESVDRGAASTLTNTRNQLHAHSDNSNVELSAINSLPHTRANILALSQHSDTNQVLSNTVNLDMAEELRAELEKQKAITNTMQQQVEQAEIANEVEKQKQEQESWQAALNKLQQVRAEQKRKHEEKLASLRVVETTLTDDSNPQLEWIKKKIAELNGGESNSEEVEAKKRDTDKAKQALENILEQQKQLSQQANTLVQETGMVTPEMQTLLNVINQDKELTAAPKQPLDSAQMLEQLRAALSERPNIGSGDWQRDVLRQFLIKSNKTAAPGGATTLKPDLLKRLTNEQDEFVMADWLATLNKEESGEWLCDDSNECKHRKVKSGMLDKATANIVHKEIWPQKNLLEDWADEEMEFRQLQFEHLVAGELRTIETCTEPAQILGRLRLLRCMAYAKLRGYDWPVIRKMYAAILRSIEAKEHAWSDNFDCFETILYGRWSQLNQQTPRPPRGDRDRDTKKWFCRDWNRPEGCTKTAPHKAWFGSGTNAVSRVVLHMCAACYMKDKAVRDHPETHQSCPHKMA